MAAHIWATSGWVGRHCITLDAIRRATRIRADSIGVRPPSARISVFITLWRHWVFLWWMLTIARLGSCLMCTLAVVWRTLLTRVRPLLLASFVAGSVACRWATRSRSVRLIRDWGLIRIVGATICVWCIAVLIRVLTCSSLTWRTLLLLRGLDRSRARLYTTVTWFDRLLLLLLNLLFFFTIICGTLPFLLLLLVFLAFLLGLHNVVHKVI